MSTWVPEDQRDPRYYIFKVKYHCRVNNLQTMSVEHIRQFGVPTSGDPVRDRQMSNELVDRMWSIAQMATYFDRGVNIRVVKREDTKAIYDAVTEYLMVWRNAIEHSLNPGTPPIDDLLMLDRFANAVYEHAKYFFTKDVVDSLLARKIGGIATVSRSMLLPEKPAPKSTENEEGEEQNEDDQFPRRESMAKVFSARRTLSSVGRSKMWK